MILKKGHATKYLQDYREGKIKEGLAIGCKLDKYIRFKKSQFIPVMGGDNTGKTFFIIWYFLCLATNHGLKFCIWTDENSSGQIMRNLIQMLSGVKFLEMEQEQINLCEDWLEEHFFFIDNKQLYSPDKLLDLFMMTEADGYLLDPFNQMEHTPTYTNNIELIRKIKRWCKNNSKTLYLTMHPVTSTGRQGALYPDKHEYSGYEMTPTKSMAEGGKIFANMCDDFIIIHRLTNHPEMKFTTMLAVGKVKDTETGGEQTEKDAELYLHYNDGCGFLIMGVDPINRDVIKTKGLTANNNFDNEFF